MTVEHRHFKWDKLGLALSGLCLLHCLGTPLLLLLFPMIHGLQGIHSSIHWVAAVLLIPMAIYAVTQGYSHHRKKVVPVLAGLGATLVLAGALSPHLMPHIHHAHDHEWYTKDLVVTILGSISLLFCHGLNIWFCRQKSSASKCHSGH